MLRAARLRALVLLALAGVLAARPAAAQSAWTANLVVQPFPSPFLTDWQRNPQTAVLTLFYTGTGAADVHIEGTVTSPRLGELAHVASPPISLAFGPVTQIFTATDILDWQTLSRSHQATDDIQRSGMIPEGPMQLCARVLGASNVELTRACADFTITLPDPPQLLFPANGMPVTGAQPAFQWTPVMLPPELGVSYHVKMVELNPQQSPATALAANPVWFEQQVSGAPMLAYPVDALPLDPQKRYAWQVEVQDAEGRPVTRGGRASEIWTFSVGGPSRENGLAVGLPDTLTLIPGVARLSGLSRATGSTTPFAFVVDGTVNLEITAPVTTVLRVDAHDLEIDRTSVGGLPQFRGGTLSGTVDYGDPLARLAGPLARFTSLTFSPEQGLVLEGKLALPGAAPIDLAGAVRLTQGGVFGTLSADASGSTPLASFGADPVRLLITQARLSLPAGAVSLGGGVELFGHDAGCASVSASVADGVLSAAVACRPSEPLPLVGDALRTRLDLQSLSGAIAVQLADGSVHDTLTASGQLVLDAGFADRPGPGCGASLALAVTDGAVSVPSFTPHCVSDEGEARLGWLHMKLSSLAIDRLAYQAGSGFDFAMHLDVSLSAPDVPGLKLPDLTGVTITPQGFALPAADVTMTGAAVRLGGFALAVTRVRLPAFTLSWDNWSAGTPAGFAFTVDGAITLPDLPGGVAACLTKDPLTVSATLSGGRLTAHIDDRTFSPACGMTLAALPGSGSGDAAGASPPGEPVRSPESAGTGANSAMAGANTGTAADDPQTLDRNELSQLQQHDADRLQRLGDPACDSACRANVAAEGAAERQATFSRWQERDLGAIEKKNRDCLAQQRQAAIAGAETTLSDECQHSMTTSTDSALSAIVARAGTLPAKPAQCDQACENRWLMQKDCRNQIDYATAAVLGVQRQRALLGGESSTTPDLAATADYCMRQAALRVQQACQSGMPAGAVQAEYADYLAAVRRSQLAGGADGSEPALAGPTCPPSAGPATTIGMLMRPGGGDETGDGGTGFGDVAAWGPMAAGEGSVPILRPLAHGTRAIRAAVATDAGGSGAGVRLEVTKFGGNLVVGFYPELAIAEVPTIEGNVVLPPLFHCADASVEQQPLLTRLRLGPHGEVDGTIEGFIPKCPVDLAAMRLQATGGSLTFSTAQGAQAVVLTASVAVSLSLATDTVRADGEIAIDVLHGRLTGGSLALKGPLRLDLPRATPLLSLSIDAASLDTAGLHVDGRGRLLLADSQGVTVTLDHVTLNPLSAHLAGGRVSFDAPFGIEAGLDPSGTLAWHAVPKGSVPTVSSGFRVDLPSQITLDSNGLNVSGDGGARLLFGGRDLDSLGARFSSDFALTPDGVRKGSVAIQRQGATLATVDALGLHANLAMLAGQLIPRRLGLPDSTVAYLELRDANGDLRVSSETGPSGVRVFTRPGASVPLVVPALQGSQPAAPRVNVTFDLTFDPATRAFTAGAVNVALSPADRAGFDLTALGIPLRIDTLAFDKGPSGAYRLAIGGGLTLFGDSTSGGDHVLLTVDGSGRVAGDVDLALNRTVPLVSGSSQLVLNLTRAAGSFDATLGAAGRVRYTLDLTGGLTLAASASQTYRASATLELTESGLTAKDISYAGADDPMFLDLPGVRLGVNHLRVPTLTWSATGGFQFEMLLDASLQFPSLGSLTLPTIKDVTLSNSGFRIPAIEIPQLTLQRLGQAAAGAAGFDTASVYGMPVTPLAFRMGAVSYNWFTGQGPADWGFAFDLELSLANLLPQAPDALRAMKVRVLNAGLHDGHVTGSIERIQFPTPVNIGIGSLRAVSGTLPGAASAGATPAPLLVFDVDLDLTQPLPFCDAHLTATGNTISVYPDGWVSAQIPGLSAQCAAQLGPVALKLGTASLDVAFQALPIGTAAAGRTPKFEVSVGATVTVPTGGSDSVSGQGTLRVDVLNHRILAGRVDLSRPFRWQPPGGNPYLAFDVSSGFLDSAGIHFTGGGSLRLADGGSVQVTFNNFVLGLPDFAVHAGSVTFQNGFALGVGIGDGGTLTWGAYGLSAARPAGNSLRLALPSSVTIDAKGIAASGTATASLGLNGQEFASLSVTFADGFVVGFKPLGVAAGSATFVANGSTIATLDAGGVHPGNVFAVLPIPARLGLPDASVAYLELKDEQGNLLIETASDAAGLHLRTRSGSSGVKLVVPALAASGGTAPSASVSFDVTVNPTTLQFVSGSVQASAATGQSLFSLQSLGIPVDITALRWAPPSSGGAYALKLSARVALPASLSTADLELTDLTLGPQGLTGTAELGKYADTYDAQLAPFNTATIGSDLTIGFTGAKFTFGPSKDFRLSGVLRSPMLSTGSGDPVPLFFTAQLSPASGLTVSVTPPAAPLPLGAATFEAVALGSQPAIQVRASAQEFAVRLSGVLRLASLGPSFGVTVDGLEVGTAGVKVPTISISGGGAAQQFSLFGATFALKDSVAGGQVVYPAIAGGYSQGVVSLALSGAVTFMDNTARFYGLTVSSAGRVSIAAANLLSAPVDITPGTLSLDSLGFLNNALHAAFRVTLPAPLSGPGPQRFAVSVGTDGSVSGGGHIVMINDAAGLANADPAHVFTVGPTKIHLRNLSADIDVTDFKKKSTVNVVAEAYLQGDPNNLIALGDVSGNTVNPGVRVGLDGTVHWGSVSLPRAFNVDMQAVRLSITNVAFPANATTFGIALAGNLSLTLPDASGSLTFENFAVNSAGEVQFSPTGVQGGNISIGGVVTLTASGFAYSATQTTIQIHKGGLPAGGSAPADPGSESVTVSSYVSFGGSVTVVDAFSGGVQQFLAYQTTDGLRHLVVRNAELDVPNVLSMHADLRYDEQQGGFAVLLGASGRLTYAPGVDVAVVGAVSQETATDGTAPKTRLGIFVAASGLSITIPGVPITVTKVGGGLFINPKPEYLDLVKSYAGVSSDASAKIAAPAGKFAVMLYGEAAMIDQSLLDGQVLITVSDQAIDIDGDITVLSQGDKLRGEGHIEIGIGHAYALGTLTLNVSYPGIVTGNGSLQFLIQDRQHWSVLGKTSVKLVDFLNATSTIFVGPLGFYANADVAGAFNVWLVSIDGNFNVQVWNQPAPVGWGGYATLGVKVSLAGGLASATGTLTGALISSSSESLLYLAGGLSAQVAGQSWTGSVYVKVENQQFSAGFGSDAAMDAIVAAARGVADDIATARDNAQNTLDAATAAAAQPVGLSNTELIAAWNRVQGWTTPQLANALLSDAEQNGMQPGEAAYQTWYFGVLARTGLPGDSELVARNGDAIASRISEIAAAKSTAQSRISALRLQLTPDAGGSAAPAVLASPVSNVHLDTVVVQRASSATGASQDVITGGPSVTVDASAAQALVAAVSDARSRAEAADLTARQRLVDLEDALAKVRAATASSDAGALPGVAREFASLGEAAEAQAASQAALILGRQDWMRARLADLNSRASFISNAITSQSAALAASDFATGFNGLHYLAHRRIEYLGAMGGNTDALLTQFKNDSATHKNSGGNAEVRNWLVGQANAWGQQLWFDVASQGMQAADAGADTAFAQLRDTSAARLAAIRAAQAGLSNSLDALYDAQAEAAGTLYDMYDRYLYWRTGHTFATVRAGAVGATAAPTSAAALADTNLIIGRLRALAQDLTVPRVTSVNVSLVSSDRYTAQLAFSWTARHASGVWAYGTRDVEGANQALGTGFLENGAQASLTGARFTADRTRSTTITRTFQVAARGGAGFAGYGRASYSVTLPGGSGSGSPTVTGSGLLADNTPPQTPVVGITGRPVVLSGGAPAIWTADPNRIDAEWEATDPESGVAEYQYALWATPSGPAGPGGAATELRPFVSAQGRTTVTLDQLGLKPGTPVYIAVKARNPGGLWSAIGVSPAIRYDATHPYFAAGAALQPSSSGAVAALRFGLGSTAAAPTAACTLPLPSDKVAAFNGRMTTETTNPAPAVANFSFPPAADSVSPIVGYWYLVGAQAATRFDSTTWTELPQIKVMTRSLALGGAPLNYTDAFYVSFVGLNAAGVPTAPLTYGPFRASDPTPPSAPQLCATPTATWDAFTAVFSAGSVDDETGVTGYQYRIRTAAGAVVRDWPSGAAVDWTTAPTGSRRTTAPLTLVSQQSYILDVRALNGRGMASDVASSGPVLIDTAPPARRRSR